MNLSTFIPNSSKVDVRLWIKVIVYGLLLINFAIYFKNDWVIASHTMRNGGSFLDWTGAFATTIDESAWICLLILFELETYILSDEPLPRAKALLMHAIRIICYVSLAHTLYAYTDYLIDLINVDVISNATNLCQLVAADVSYAYNLVYTELNTTNCQILSTASQFYYLDAPENIIVSDSAGLNIETNLAWADVIEVVAWLIILLTMELTVRIQDRGIATGTKLKVLKIVKLMFYLILWAIIVFWLDLEHWMFAWDEFVWISGFFVIEMNMSQWRDEIIEAESNEKQNTVSG